MDKWLASGNNKSESMLSNTTTTPSSNLVMQNSSVASWPILEPALDKLFPIPSKITERSCTLNSEDFLKLYTLVFEHCVGTSSSTISSGKRQNTAAGLICGEDLYVTLVKYLESRLIQWSSITLSLSDDSEVFDNVLLQLDRIQAAEKPLIFIFTYLERHWIDRQINEQRVDVLPMKQLIWSLWDSLVLNRIWGRILPVISGYLGAARKHQIPLEELSPIARFVHYLRVISKPSQLESDFNAVKRITMAGAVINPRASHVNRFKDFVNWYCESIEKDAPSPALSIEEFIQTTLQFWNDEEGRMVFLRFDKSAQVNVRNHMKSLLLLPNLDAFKAAFHDSIMNWRCLEANSIYRLLANRKSLLVHLDSEIQRSLILKGQDLMNTNISRNQSSDEIERVFINLIGEFYNLSTELIQTSLASRPEIFEARSRAFSQLLNDPPNFPNRKGFAARSLAKFADFLVRSLNNSRDPNSLQVLSALFRLIDEKEEFQETYGKLLSLRLLTGVTEGKAGAFEQELLAGLKQTCGAYFVSNFERMFNDINEVVVNNIIVLTGATWNIRGKLLPGHPLLLQEDSNSSFTWPPPIEQGISTLSRNYHAKFPKRKLFWSPLLSFVEFNYFLPLSGSSVCIKGTCVHLSMLQSLSQGIQPTFTLPSSSIVLDSLCRVGLVLFDESARIYRLNESFSLPGNELDLYTETLSELLLFNARNGNGHNTQHSSQRSLSGTPKSFTPRSFSTVPTSGNSSSHSHENLSPLDKSILLQCAITRIMKQLRLLALMDLFNRISMLPKLLTRFSPSVEDILEALKQLHEKEFIKLAFGDLDDLVDAEKGDLERLHQAHQNLFIKYMA